MGRKGTRRRRLSAIGKAAELSFAVPQVVALRSARMLAAGMQPGARDRQEFLRMGTEKVQAYNESMQAMAVQMYKTSQDLALFALREWWTAWSMPYQMMGAWHAPGIRARSKRAQRKVQSEMLKVATQGWAPVHRRATANARRLSRAKKV